MDSSSGQIPPACLDALLSLMQQCFNHGFYLSLRFLPQGANDPYEWARNNSYDYGRASHNWTFTAPRRPPSKST
jgi:hypothetical protein